MKVSDDMYIKQDCGVTTSTKMTMAFFTDSACTTAYTVGSTAHVDTEDLACNNDNGNEDYYRTYTCGSAPSAHAEATIWTTSSCTTASYTTKFALVCSADYSSSGSGNATTWTPGSSMAVFEGTASNTTGLVIKAYSTADCSGATSATTTMGVQCSNSGDAYMTITAAGSVASVANSLFKLSPLVGFFCTAATLKYL